MDVPAADRAGYQKMMRDARIDLTKRGIYDETHDETFVAIPLQTGPKNFECALHDENYK